MKSAIIFGATGLTGKELFNNLLGDERYDKIYNVVRKKRTKNYLKAEEIIFDFKDFSSLPKVTADHVFCCLGTTIKKAGSQEAQQIIDRDYPIAIAKYAKEINADKLVCISSVGANKESRNFYLRTKGEMEEGVKKNFENAVFVRPSFIFGKRDEVRPFERIGISLFYIINPFLPDKLSKYKGIDANKLAHLMIDVCYKNTPQILHYSEFMKYMSADVISYTKQRGF
jgi:uncharacterized protein YbjT (DUF2867 family)